MKAHEVETVHLGQQSGIQDQICSAHGGISFIDMDEYPHATVKRVDVDPAVRDELESRLSVIFLGRTHHSSSVHEEVIRGLLEGGSTDKLEPLRREAVAGRDALLAGDLAAFGAAMIRNTEAQANLHASLVSETARKTRADWGCRCRATPHRTKLCPPVLLSPPPSSGSRLQLFKECLRDTLKRW